MRGESRAACEAYRLATSRHPLAGRLGERMGHATGSSLEFMDFRDYQPGDDLRHVDWRAFARTDRLQVRLYRDEVAPWLDIVADLSPSMAVTQTKAQALRDLVEAVAFWGDRGSSRVRRLQSGGTDFLDAEAVAFDGPGDGALLPRESLRPRGVRVLISDFLFPGDPGPAIRGLCGGAAQAWVVQLLDPEERSPTAGGTWTLVDCESDARSELTLDRATVDAYRRRLQALGEAVRGATIAAGGAFAEVQADAPAAMFRALLAAGMLEPAS